MGKERAGRWPKAILFDLDDTLVGDDSLSDVCWSRACGRYWRESAAGSPMELREAIRERADWFYSDPDRFRQGRLDLGRTRREIVERALAALGSPSSSLAAAIADAYGADKERSLDLVPGALETLRRFKELGVGMGLVTNGSGDLQRAKVRRFSLDALFDSVVIEGEFGVGKPDARVYLTALGEIGTRPEEAWMVGDHLEFDVAAPQRLGMRGIWVDAKGRGVPAGSGVKPDLVVTQVSDLLQG